MMTPCDLDPSPSSIVGFGPGHAEFDSRYPPIQHHHPQCLRHYPSQTQHQPHL